MVNLIPAETVQLLVDLFGVTGTLVLLAILVVIVVGAFARILFSRKKKGPHYEETEEEFLFGGEAAIPQALSSEIKASHGETYHGPGSD